MPSNPLVGILTPTIRQALYIGYALLVLVSGALDIVYDVNPTWLTKGDDVLNYLGGALMLTAASNIAKADPQPNAAVEAATAEHGYIPERARNEDDPT